MSGQYVGVYLIIQAVIIVTAAVLSSSMASSLKAESAKLRPYAWGYFIGLLGLTSSALPIILVLIFPSDSTPFVISICIVTSTTFFYIIKRNRIAWIIGTFFYLNPLVWIINGIYLRNRWSEMGNSTVVNNAEKDWVSGTGTLGVYRKVFSKLSQSTRIYIAASSFWLFLVPAFVLVFEPYGYLSDSDIAHLLKVMFFPPAALIFGHFLYMKVVKQQAE